MRKPNAGMRGRRRLACWSCLLALLLAGASPAAEVVVEGLSGVRKYAPVWPGGTFEIGNDAGLSWARIVTDGQGGSTFVSNVRPYRPLIDGSDKFVKIKIKVDDVSALGGLEFRLSSDRFASDFFAFTFPIYDDPDFNQLRDGVWTTLTFSFGSATVEGTPDRSAINSIGWYVSDKGNGTPVTAYWAGLSLLDEPAEGVVSITFDEGYDEHLLAAKLMTAYGFQGTAYVIPEAVGRTGYLSLHQLVDLQDSYGWDVAALYGTPFTDLRPDELENVILGIQGFLIQNEFGDGAGHLAYPEGRQNTSLVRPLVRKHFATARITAQGPETLPPADRHLLRVFDVTSSTKPEEVGAAARQASENKEWLILTLHYLVEEPTNSAEYSIDNFKKILDEIKAAKVRVLPMARVWSACSLAFSSPAPASGCRFDQAVAAPKR